jgi:hypothetical protein
MRFPGALVPLAAAFVFVLPTHAYAADNSLVVPDWLSVLMAGVGLFIAIILVIDAVLLRRVAEGSVVADNIQYMMLAVIVFGLSSVGRWFVTLTDDEILSVQLSFTADLLVIAGMALLAVYFYRVRAALARYLTVLEGTLDGGESDDTDSEDSAE